MAEGAGFSGRYANKPLPDVSGVRFGLKLLLVSAGIIVVGESLPAARLDERKRFGLLLTAFFTGTRALPSRKARGGREEGEIERERERGEEEVLKGRK